jgi:hypothetical protein
MRKLPKSIACGFILALFGSWPLPAQTPGNVPAAGGAAADKTTPDGQAPSDVMKKLLDLVHAGKYLEAQQLTSGLLLAYPDDQRLIKGQALIAKLLSPADLTSPDLAGNAPGQLGLSANPEALTGMDKVDFSALIELARQAQQTADLAEQKKLLQQFMQQSSAFLAKHPSETLLWQLRAASAISLNDPAGGYDAGEKLLAAGAADGNDANALRILAQLRNKGWLDQQGARQQAAEITRYDWILGTWGLHFTRVSDRGKVTFSGDEKLEFSRADSEVLGYVVADNGVKDPKPRMRGTLLDSGEIRWEIVHSPGWQSVLSSELANDKKTFTVSFPVVLANKKGQEIATWSLHKN